MENAFETLPKDDRLTYAGFWERFAAYLIDSFIVGIPLAIFTVGFIFIVFGVTGTFDTILNTSSPENMTEQQVIGIIIGYLVIVALNIIIISVYFAGMHASKWQATIGKKLLHLKVVDLEGNRISFWRALGRYAAMAFLSGIFLIGYLLAAFTEKKQALHDLIAGTLVIKS